MNVCIIMVYVFNSALQAQPCAHLLSSQAKFQLKGEYNPSLKKKTKKDKKKGKQERWAWFRLVSIIKAVLTP